jgi:N-acetylmuramoyl-L-alanine amidase
MTMLRRVYAVWFVVVLSVFFLYAGEVARSQEAPADTKPSAETAPPVDAKPSANTPAADTNPSAATTSPADATPSANAPAADTEPSPDATKAARCERAASFRVVIDVGHTVDKPGADSARGVTEYSFNVKLADAIMQALTDLGFEKAVRLITTTPPWRGLVERAERANAMHADLLISIHHDSVPDRLIETWEYEGKQNHFSDRFKGYAIFMASGNGNPKGSLEFGHLLGEELQARGLKFTPHYTLPLMGKYRHELVDPHAGVYRYDLLVVLRTARMPAVLLEAGSIVNRDEELALAGPERRGLTAAAVASAVNAFCKTRLPATTNQHIRRPPRPNLATPAGHTNPVSVAQ